jgi:signal transduction histidine kinase/DNA-binding response OmpR family regulator
VTVSRPDIASDDALFALLGAADEGLVAFDADGTVTFANPAALSLLGGHVGVLVGSRYTAMGVPELERRVERALGGASRASGRFRLQLGECYVSAHIARSRGASRTVSLALRDETELVDERDRNEAVLAATADGLVLLDPGDAVTYINPAACSMLRVTRRQVMGKRVSIDELLGVESEGAPARPDRRCADVRQCAQIDCPAYSGKELRCWLVTGTLCHPESGPCTFEKKRTECVDCDFHRTYAEAFDPLGSEAVSEIELPHEDHDIVVKARVTAVVDEAGSYIGRVLALRDVTTEREIADMKNEFVSTVSHELRTPLTSIKGYVDLILDGSAGEVSDIQREFLGIVKENSDRLVELINEMLDISRIESGRVHLKVEPLDLAESVTGAVDTFRAVLSQTDRTVEVHLPERLPLVVADRDRVGQVLINLISNAIKYSPGGGQVSVTAKHAGEQVVVSVTDQGLGIGKDDQKRLFTKFYRVDTAMTREIGGTGLGLSICKTIIELLGGEIGCRSKLGQGSTFWFSLPLAPQEMVRMPSLEGPDDVGGTVLVIDRDPEVADLIQTYLVRRGYDVVQAHTADDALETALRVKPRAITLDVILDEGDGFDLLHRLKENPETKDIPVVVLSIVCDEGKSCRMGAASYLEKPIDQGRLLKMIDDIVGSISSPVALVVDDDRDTVKVLSETLRKKGFAVVAAYDGTEAVAALEQRGIPNIIVTDLKMPKMDGYDLIKRVKTTPEWADVPIVVMTAHRIDRGRLDVLELATYRMHKPFSPEMIAEEVGALIVSAREGAPA